MARTSTIVHLLMRYGPKTPKGWIGVAILGVVYLFAQPVLNSSLGLNLPGVFDGGSSSGGSQTAGDSPRGSSGGGPAAGGEASVADILVAAEQPVAETPTQSRDNRGARNDGRQLPDAKKAAAAKDRNTEAKAQPPLGKLTKIGDMVFETTAGLVYTRGSADGHRLKHVMKHAVDSPNRPVHSVFEPGDERSVFAVIDEAFLIADLEGPPRARKTNERGRTIWIVDMKRPVGYVGGQKGKRKGFPKVEGIKLVLQGRNVITAFPDDVR